MHNILFFLTAPLFILIGREAFSKGQPSEWQISFQDAASPLMQNLIDLHDFVFWIITFITIFVFILLAYVCVKFSAKNNKKPSVIIPVNFAGVSPEMDKIFKKAKKNGIKIIEDASQAMGGYFKGKNSKGTNIDEAIEYSSRSKVDAMAISVGNTHLQTSKVAKIDFNKILEIQKITKLPLVLHGSSGISNNVRKKLARMTNVGKFNIGTELRMVGCKSLRKSYNKNINNFDKISILKPSIVELKKATIKVIKNIGPINAKK